MGFSVDRVMLLGAESKTFSEYLKFITKIYFSCYYFSNDPMTFTQAQNFCWSLGGYGITSISDISENNFIAGKNSCRDIFIFFI